MLFKFHPIYMYIYLSEKAEYMTRANKFSFHTSDVNECAFGSGPCSQICTNTLGSFTCSCEEGFQLASDGRGCIGMLVATLLHSLPLVKFNILCSYSHAPAMHSLPQSLQFLGSPNHF